MKADPKWGTLTQEGKAADQAALRVIDQWAKRGISQGPRTHNIVLFDESLAKVEKINEVSLDEYLGPEDEGGPAEMRLPGMAGLAEELGRRPAPESDDPIEAVAGRSKGREELEVNPPEGAEKLDPSLLPDAERVYLNDAGLPIGDPGRAYEARSAAERYGHHEDADPQLSKKNEGPGDLWIPYRQVPANPDTPQTTILPRKDVMEPLSKFYGQPVHETRMGPKHGAKDVWGAFWGSRKIPKKKGGGRTIPQFILRLRRWGDLETYPHEMGHFLQEIHRDFVDPFIQRHKEILSRLSYEKTKPDEGFAEMIRLWSTNQDWLHRHARDVFLEWDNFVRNVMDPKEATAWLTYQERAHAFFNAGRTHYYRSRVKKDDASLLATHRDFTSLTEFRQSWLDDRYGIAAAELYLYGYIVPGGGYEMAKALRHVRDWAEILIEKGTPEIELSPDGRIYRIAIDTTLGGYFDGLRKFSKESDEKLNDFLFYLTAYRADELRRPQPGATGPRRHGVDPGLPKEVIDEGLKLRQKYGPDFHEEALRIVKMNRKLPDFLVKLGAISQERADWILRYNQRYTHKFARQGPFVHGPIRAVWTLDSKGTPLRGIKGSSRGLEPVLEQLIDGPLSLMQFGLENYMRRIVVDEIRAMPKGGHFLQKLPPKSEKVRIHIEEVWKALDAALEDAGLEPVPEAWKEAPELRGFIEAYVHGNKPSGQIVTVLRDGQPEYYEVFDPWLWRAFLASQRKEMTRGWINVFDKLRRFKQAAIVYTPNFAVSNLFRDAIWAKVMSEVGYQVFADSVRGIGEAYRRTPEFWDRRANLGGFSGHRETEYMLESRLRGHMSPLDVEVNTPRELAARVGKLILKGARGYARGIETFEHAPRQGVYRRAIERGETPFRAGFLAGDVTADWTTRGDSSSAEVAYRTIPFFKAAMVGTENYTRKAFMDPRTRGFAEEGLPTWAGGSGAGLPPQPPLPGGQKRFGGLDPEGKIPNRDQVAGRMAMAAMASAALYLWNSQYEDFQDLPDEMLRNYWHFYLPHPTEPGRFIHLMTAKTWDVGLLANVMESFTQELLETGFQIPDRSGVDSVLKALALNFGIELPHPIGMLSEQYFNWDRFRGGQIVTGQYGRGRSARFMQYGEHTSPFLVQLARHIYDKTGIDFLSPQRAEHFVEGLAGTAGAMALGVLDAITTPEGAKRDRRWYEYQVARRFYAPEGRFSRYRDDWYELFGTIDAQTRTLSKLEKQIAFAQPEERELLIKLYTEFATSPEHTGKGIQRVQQVIDKLRLDLRSTMADPSLPPRQKTDYRERKLREIDKWMKDAVQQYHAIEERLQ